MVETYHFWSSRSKNKLQTSTRNCESWANHSGRANLQHGSRKVATCVAQSCNMHLAKSQHGSHKVARWLVQCCNMRRANSQHGSLKVATWVEQSRNMLLAKPQHASRKVAICISQSRNMGRTKSQHGLSKVATWVEQSRNMLLAKPQHASRKVAICISQSRTMRRANSQHGSCKVATWVEQSRNMFLAKSQPGSCKVATCVGQSCNMGRARSQHGQRESSRSKHIKTGSTRSEHTIFGRVDQNINCKPRPEVAKVEQITLVAQICNILILSRAKSQIAFCRAICCKYFGRAKSQHTNFVSQCLQHTFFGSRKVATYLFWVGQSWGNTSVAQSRKGCIISPRTRPGNLFKTNLRPKITSNPPRVDALDGPPTKPEKSYLHNQLYYILFYLKYI